MSVNFAVDAAQALLTGFDIGLSRIRYEEERGWRNEDRKWHGEDMQWREEERHFYQRDIQWREEERRWRAHDLEQRCLDNARWIWSRFVEKNRRDVEEKSEQLKTVSNLAALIAGFAVVAFVEFQFHDSGEVPDQNIYIISAYAAATAITFGLMMNAMVLCSLMLAAILKNGKTYVSEEEEAQFMFQCRRFAHHYQSGHKPPAPRRTFEKHWDQRCETSWRLAFWLFSLGIPTFMVSLVFAGWLKFNYSLGVCWLVTTLIFVSFVFWVCVEKSWAPYLVDRKTQRSASYVETTGSLPFDWHASHPRRVGHNMHPVNPHPTSDNARNSCSYASYPSKDSEADPGGDSNGNWQDTVSCASESAQELHEPPHPPPPPPTPNASRSFFPRSRSVEVPQHARGFSVRDAARRRSLFDTDQQRRLKHTKEEQEACHDHNHVESKDDSFHTDHGAMHEGCSLYTAGEEPSPAEEREEIISPSTEGTTAAHPNSFSVSFSPGSIHQGLSKAFRSKGFRDSLSATQQFEISTSQPTSPLPADDAIHTPQGLKSLDEGGVEDESVTCEEPVQLGKDETIVHNASGPRTLGKNKTLTGTPTAKVDSTVTRNSIEARDAMEDRWSGVNVIHSKSVDLGCRHGYEGSSVWNYVPVYSPSARDSHGTGNRLQEQHAEFFRQESGDEESQASIGATAMSDDDSSGSVAPGRRPLGSRKQGKRNSLTMFVKRGVANIQKKATQKPHGPAI